MWHNYSRNKSHFEIALLFKLVAVRNFGGDAPVVKMSGYNFRDITR